MPYTKEQMKQRYEKRKEQGMCAFCFETAIQGTTQCVEHTKTNRVKTAERVKKKREEASVTGLCYRCKQPTLPNRLSCFVCTIKTAAKDHLGNYKRFPELLELLERQNYLCPYTGKKLIIGDNASIDHILPHSLYPNLKYEITNLEWIDLDINIMKKNRTKEEFCDLIFLIAYNLEEKEI